MRKKTAHKNNWQDLLAEVETAYKQSLETLVCDIKASRDEVKVAKQRYQMTLTLAHTLRSVLPQGITDSEYTDAMAILDLSCEIKDTASAAIITNRLKHLLAHDEMKISQALQQCQPKLQSSALKPVLEMRHHYLNMAIELYETGHVTPDVIMSDSPFTLYSRGSETLEVDATMAGAGLGATLSDTERQRIQTTAQQKPAKKWSAVLRPFHLFSSCHQDNTVHTFTPKDIESPRCK